MGRYNGRAHNKFDSCTAICTGSTFQLQTERYCASLLVGESSGVPGRLWHTSFGSRRPSITTLSQ